MKKLSNITKVFAVVLFTTFAMAASAQPYSSKIENPAELKYVGVVNNHPRVLLSLNNSEPDEFVVNITDQTGASIFAENLAGKFVSRTYQLDTDDMDSAVLNFQVYSKKTNSTVTYKVNNNQRFIQDVVINRK